MIVSLIVAMDEVNGIGFQNRLPWRLSDDLRRFKQLTMGHHLILGRKTFESVGKPLPGRQMIVLSRNPDYPAQGCPVFSSLEQALEAVQEAGETEAFIGGGVSIYAQALPLADRIYLTRVHAKVQADVFFPPFDAEAWEEKSTSRHEADDKNEYAATFQILERKIQPTG